MVLYCTPLAKNTSKLRVLVGFQKIRPVFRSAPGAPWEIHVHGRSSRELFGEIGLSEFRIVFAEVFICPETMRLLQESSRESHFEATVTRFEFPWRIGRKPDMRQVGLPRARALAFLHWKTPPEGGRKPRKTRCAAKRRKLRAKRKRERRARCCAVVCVTLHDIARCSIV